MKAIEVSGLVRRFGEFTAVGGVSLAVDKGEIYGFLGPNGAGKSTTVRMLCTLLAITEGRASVAGYDVASQADQVRLRIGVALQESAIDEKQTGREVIELSARLYGLRGSVLQRRVAEVIDFVDIGDAMDRFVKEYSGGMKRRLDLAASLVHDPQVLFLDEPTTGLDPVSRARVWQEVERLRNELGMTVFLTTQYLEEADALADRVGIIDGGVLVAEGTPGALKRSVGNDLVTVHVGDRGELASSTASAVRGVESVRLDGETLTVTTADGSSLVGPLVVALNGAQVEVGTLSVRTPTLDDVFLAKTGHHLEPGEEPAR
ncbi:MAG: ATP-binding cassette domain-containing protein [Acidimicrobiales bacterium]|nr:ATP-binding cassette domain-containing protein [Acidimicrobiales bacterium]